MRIRKALVAVAVFAMCFILMSPLLAENHSNTAKVLTRNMYPGADLAVFATVGDEGSFMAAVLATIDDINASDIPERAAGIAAEIAKTKPDLVALQEATTWTIRGDSGTVVINQLDLLMKALKASGQHYKIALVQNLTDIDMGVMAYADHDVILVRSDLPRSQLNILGSESHIYDSLLSFDVLGQEVSILRGWMAVDVSVCGSKFRFVNTHLESPFGDDYTKGVQVSQADQLMEDLSETNLPIILAGDFNSDAENTHFYYPDVTDSYSHIVASGFEDAWDELRPRSRGYTWPLMLDNAPTAPIERIDLIFSSGPKAISIIMTGLDPLDGLHASDHAGVLAVFDLLNHTFNHGRIPFYQRNQSAHYGYHMPASLLKHLRLLAFRRH